MHTHSTKDRKPKVIRPIPIYKNVFIIILYNPIDRYCQVVYKNK